MPINFLGTVFSEGTSAIPYYNGIRSYGPYVVGGLLVKKYFTGASNTWDRDLHGRVVLITGGTSGVGAAVTRYLAGKGAQVILLVRTLRDQWLIDYINDLREATGNHLIYAEEANLADFFSIRKFATSWINNSPPRRIDMIICCAAVALPPGSARSSTSDGVESHLQVNYLGHYHLLTLLSPAIRAQPPDRDVRVILTSCVSSVLGDFDMADLEFEARGYPSYTPWRAIGASKLALCMFGYEFQRRLAAYERPDKAPVNTHLTIVDPGMMRSPSFKRFASMGSIVGLIVYILLWPIWWIFLKTSLNGSESLLHAICNPELKDTLEVCYVSDSRIRNRPPRKELKDVELQKKLFDYTEKIILEAEKNSVISRKRNEAEKGTESPSDPKEPTLNPTANGESDANGKAKTVRRSKAKSKRV